LQQGPSAPEVTGAIHELVGVLHNRAAEILAEAPIFAPLKGQIHFFAFCPFSGQKTPRASFFVALGVLGWN